MDPTRIGFFALADRKLAWLGKRQEVLAQNIANADTPGWQSRDLVSFSATLANATVEPVRTNRLHLSGSGDETAARLIPQERAPDGNSVSVEDELTRVADTQTAQALVTNLYKSYLGMFQTALGR